MQYYQIGSTTQVVYFQFKWNKSFFHTSGYVQQADQTTFTALCSLLLCVVFELGRIKTIHGSRDKVFFGVSVCA